jgi:putative membrane protein
VLVIGLLRVFFFEKGPAYYFHDAAFIAKLSLFGVALIILCAAMMARGIGFFG